MILSVHLVPNASRSEVVGWVGETLKIRIAAPPIEGRANEALVDFLADQLNLAPSEIEIMGGMSSKHKRVKIPLAEEDVRRIITPPNLPLS